MDQTRFVFQSIQPTLMVSLTDRGVWDIFPMYEATCIAAPSPSIRVGNKSGSMVRVLELYGINTNFVRMKAYRIPSVASIQSKKTRLQ